MSDVGSDPSWAVVGVEPLHGNTALVDQEFGEVPGDTLCEPALLLLLQVLEQGNGVVAVHLDLGEQVKLAAFLLPYKMFNLTVVARLLPAKLVAGEGEDGEIWRELIIKIVHFGVVLVGQTSFGGDVDDEDHFTFVLGHGHVVVVNVQGVESINVFRQLAAVTGQRCRGKHAQDAYDT